MLTALARFTLLVEDYDEALLFYVDKLGFEVLIDTRLAEDIRFVHVGIPGQEGIGIWFIRATTDAQRARVGRQTDGEPCFVLYTDDCRQAYQELRSRGVQFLREPEEHPGEIVAHFRDLYGNIVVLVELQAGT